MKKLGKFMLGYFGLICEGTLPVVPFIISTLLVIYMNAWFAFTFILTIPLVFYLVIIINNLSCTSKFIEWTFGMEIGE
jgi:hypothetical protein